MEKLEEYKWPILKGLMISLFFLYFFIKGRLLGESDFYNLLDLIFGIYYYFLILYPLLICSSVFLRDKRRERVLKIRLYSGLLFFFFCTFLIVIEELKLYTTTGIPMARQLVRISWKEMNLGGAATSIIHLLYFNVEEVLLYRVVLSCVFITGFILFTKMITESIRGAFRAHSKRRERRELQRKEREIREKISIKEEIDKKMNLKKQKNLMQQEEKIKQEVDRFINGEETREESLSKDITQDDLLEFGVVHLEEPKVENKAVEEKLIEKETEKNSFSNMEKMEGVENDIGI